MSQLKVNDTVFIRPRFGEPGIIIETKVSGGKTIFSIKCESCEVPLWFSEDELYQEKDDSKRRKEH